MSAEWGLLTQTLALLAALAPGAAGVRVSRKRVTRASGGEPGLTHAVLARRSSGHHIIRCQQPHLAHIASGAEGVRVLGQGVTIALGGKTLAHHAPGGDIKEIRSGTLPGLAHLVSPGHVVTSSSSSQSQPGSYTGHPELVRSSGGLATHTWHRAHQWWIVWLVSGCHTLTFRSQQGLWLADWAQLWSQIGSECLGKYWVRLLIWRKNERHWLWRWHCLYLSTGQIIDPLNMTMTSTTRTPFQ